jgi:NAD(P)H-hydrate epimerase
VDQYAIQTLGIPGVVLMENAGRNAADLIEKWARRKLAASPFLKRGPRVSIVCGRGNNGGDGFVVARHLSLRGFDVAVDVLGEAAGLSPDAAVNCASVRKMGVPVRAFDEPGQLAAVARRWRRSAVLVDALLGTGFAGEVREPLAEVIRRINALRPARGKDGSPLVVAVDVPSGLNADTGEPGGVAVRADHTVTFVAMKTGFAVPAARTHTGRITVVDIGAPVACQFTGGRV